MTATFTPALGHSWLSGLYDPAIALLTRERIWREALLTALDPRARDRIVDIGCGTGSLAALIKKEAPGSQVIGIDPDGDILDRARVKTRSLGVEVEFVEGFARDVGRIVGEAGADKIVSSLVFHQLPLPEKRAGLAACLRALKPGGRLHIADHGLQRTAAMRTAFRIIQALDGHADTQPNADGVIPVLLAEVGFAEIEETTVFPTPTGSISLSRAVRP